MALPSALVRDNTVKAWKNIADLLKNGMFIGKNAGHVAESIQFLEANIQIMQAMETADDKPVEPLKVVPDAVETPTPEMPEQPPQAPSVS